MKIMDINDIKSTAGVVFNKQDPRFESVVDNHVIGRKKVMLETNKSNKYLRYFYVDITNLANNCFFVQKGKEMFACGIENCSIVELSRNSLSVECALLASFHFYSNKCGFYRISDVLICYKTINEKQEFAFQDYSKSHFENAYYEDELYGEKRLMRLHWRQVYDCSDLTNVFLKNYYFQSNSPLKYKLEILKNNEYFFVKENLFEVNLLTSVPDMVAFTTDTPQKEEIILNFYNFIDNNLAFSIPKIGCYEKILFPGSFVRKSELEKLSSSLKNNPMFLFSPKELEKVYYTLITKIQNRDFSNVCGIKKYPTEKFEFTFKSEFNKKSDIAVILASQSKAFKRISVDVYYTSFCKLEFEALEGLYFALREIDYEFEDDFLKYINKFSILKQMENLLQVWKLLREQARYDDMKFGSTHYEECETLYTELYEQKIKGKNNNLYERTIGGGIYFGKWKSEQKMYALIVRYFSDAIYQYQDKWLGLQSLDVYIPSLKIAFEYQGEQHYAATDFFGGEEKFKIRQERDARKRKLCLENGVTLIEWRYDEEITKENLATKLQPFIDELPEENLNYTWEDEKLKLALAKEAKEKEKKSLKPKVPTKVLVQYDIDGNHINHFISQEEASQKTGASRGTISFVINGRQKTSGGYVWRYFDADKIPEKIEKTEITTPEAKEVMQLDLDGNIIETFPSITSASKICGVCTKNIRNVINGKQKTAGGYKWKRKE